MKTYKKPISVLVEIEADDILAGSPPQVTDTGDQVHFGSGTEYQENLDKEGDYYYGNSKGSSWE